MNESIQITVYRVFIDNEFVFIAKSEEEALAGAKDSYWYDERPNGICRIVPEDKTLVCVQGELHNWSDNNTIPNYHVHWKCPKCKSEHQTDTTNKSPSSEIWFCEKGSLEDVFYVQW